MPAWGWGVIGALLLGAEMFLVDAQFYLVFLGAAALWVALLSWLLPLSSTWQWLIFAASALFAMWAFRKRLYEQLRKPQQVVPEALMVGERVMLSESLQPDEVGRADYRGTQWTVRNVDTVMLQGEVAIRSVEGLTLQVQRVT